MGSKSVGEPPLLLSTSVLTAFQSAIAAAKEGLAAQQLLATSDAAAGASNGARAWCWQLPCQA